MKRTDERFASGQIARDEARGCDVARPEQLPHLAHRQGQAEDERATLERKLLLLGEELDRTHRETVRMLIRIAAHRDDESAAHVKRMGLYALHLAQCMGLDDGFCTTISFAARLHDIGKIGIPDGILEAPEALDGAQWRVMKMHCELGAGMLSQHTSPYLAMAADIARAHHENWDATGYPRGLEGEAIPRAARITRLCDSYDVLRSRRAYKTEVSHRVAVQAILGGDARSQPHCFDPAALAAFESGVEGFRDIFETVKE